MVYCYCILNKHFTNSRTSKFGEDDAYKNGKRTNSYPRPVCSDIVVEFYIQKVLHSDLAVCFNFKMY